jgi:hypothetical protein
MNLADLVRCPRIVEDTLGKGGLTRVDVGGDANVSDEGEWGDLAHET